MDQLLQRSVAELWAEEDEAGLAFYKKSSRLVTSKRQGIHRRDDGRKLEVEFRSRPASFAGVAATVFIVEDVTEQREAARTTARLNAFVTTTAALWRSTVDAIQAPLLILDAADRVFDLNLAAAQHLGVRVGDAIGLPFSGFCQQEPCLTALTLAQESRRLDSPTERHIDNLPEGRSCLVRCSTVPDSDDGAGMRVVLLLQDTTHLVQLQRKMDNDAAFATLGAIVAAVAHDVRGPLASLTVNLDALAVERAGDPSVDAALPSLHRSITRISHLMQALLDYGRPAGETSERGNLFETARSALAAVRDSAAAAGVHVALNGDDVLRPRMDRWRIQQAIENLVFNAVQHSPRDGAVLLEIDRFEKQNVAFARCCVSDSGEGFLPDCLPRIFEPFYSRRRGGTGLGLAIVQRIADQHNGEVRAENRAEGGAAVTLEWPVD